jgi:hypothetical protein
MKQTYLLGLDAAKHKIRVALSDSKEHLLLEKTVPCTAPATNIAKSKRKTETRY